MAYEPSASSPVSHSTMYAPPLKDYEAAFGGLLSQYGLGGLPTPPLPQTAADSDTRKWYKRWSFRSSSTDSLIKPTAPPPSSIPTRGALTESELRFGKLVAEYGHGLVSPANSNQK